MSRKLLHTLWFAISLSIACFAARADGIDGPDMYVYIDVSAREITLEGMRQRLALLQSSEYSAETDDAIDSQTRLQIADVYVQFATTPAAHAAYGTRQGERIEAWLNENPDWKNRYATLDSQFRSLSDQLSASRRTQ
ncbi:MAG: hypothetical protein ACREV5_13280 [Steroidobacter sp.]